jgi:methylmalonyl-CoA mutase N-terminal domain/subunit
LTGEPFLEYTVAGTTQRGVLMEERFTPSGIEVKPLYTPEDIKGIDYNRDLGDAGEYPFTRGLYHTGYRKFSWMKREISGLGLPEDTNKRVKYLIEMGQESYGGLPTANFCFDMPTQYGYDSDHPLSQYEVGRCGVSINTLKDMEMLFEGLPFEQLNPSYVIDPTANIILAMYVAVADAKGVPRRNLRGNSCTNPLRGWIGGNMMIFPPRPSLRVMMDVVRFCTEQMPYWNPINLEGYDVRSSGGTATQEMAFLIAEAFEVIRAGINMGLEVDSFVPRLSFMFASDANFFEEIAKIRAGRRIWARAIREQFGAKDRRSWLMRIHIHTAAHTLTAQEPLNNIARTAIQTLAAALAGIQGLHTCSYDEALDIPTEESARVALRTQQIIEQETGMTDVVDPLGGSYYVEWLTNQMEEKIQKYLDKIEGMGGYIAALENGYLQTELANASLKKQLEVERGERIVVGVNKYITDEKVSVNLHAYDPKVREIAVQRLHRVKKERDNQKVRDILNEIKRAAENGAPLMPLFIEAVKVYATIGEITEVLREVFGEWDKTPVLATVSI